MSTTTRPTSRRKPAAPAKPVPDRLTGDLAIVASDVCKTYGAGDAAVHALDGLSVAFRAGEFAAVMGPSGSGKSTLMHCLAGLDTADSGRIRVADIDVMRLDEDGRTRLRRTHLGFVFQAFNLIPSLTARENIELPLTLARHPVDRTWLDALAEALGIADRLEHRPAAMSGGQQQRVAVARALVTKPAIVFADEPTGNLDSQHGSQLLQFLARAVAEFGQTVVMVTHDPRAASYADRVVFLADGRLAHELHKPAVEDILTAMSRLSTAGA